MLLATKQVTNLVRVAAVNKWGHLSALYSCFSIILLLFSHFFSCKLGFIKTLTLPVMEPEIDSAGVSSNKVWWVLVLFTGAPWVFMCACPGVALILIDFLLGCWMHRWTFSKDFCPSNALFQHQRSLSVKDQRTWNMKACPMTHPGLFGCVNLSTAGLSLMVIPDWPFFFFFCRGRSPEVNSNFGNLKKNYWCIWKSNICVWSFFVWCSRSRRALGGFPSEGRRWYCSLWFASVGLIIQWFCRQRGIVGAQTRSSAADSWTVTVPIVPHKQCLHFDVCDAWPAEGSFFNLCLSPQIPLSAHHFCAPPHLPQIRKNGISLFAAHKPFRFY